MSNKENNKMRTSKSTKTIKNTSYQEIDNAIWLYSQASGAKLKKMTNVPKNLKGEYREDFITEMISFYEKH
jgi:hypothetical protein